MTEEYSSKDLDHLGIVSAMCDETHIPQVKMHSRIISEMAVPKFVEYGA
jgi:hypothetical protein